MSPTMVNDFIGQRRASRRHCIGESSWASSTTTCPYVQVRSWAAVSAVVRRTPRASLAAASCSASTTPSTPRSASVWCMFSRDARAFSRLRSCWAANSPPRPGVSRRPSSSAASSSRGTSASVQGASAGRRSVPTSASESHGAAARSRSSRVRRSPISFSGVSGIQQRLSAMRTSREVRTSSSRRSRCTGVPEDFSSFLRSFSASSRTRIFTNVTRASLWGLRVARALSRARRTMAGLSLTAVPSIIRRRGSTSRRWRCATAWATASTMSSRPFTAAASRSRSGTARTPGISVPSEDITTPVSPSEGSTRSMYRMNAVDGPTISTPERARRSRWVYSR